MSIRKVAISVHAEGLRHFVLEPARVEAVSVLIRAHLFEYDSSPKYITITIIYNKKTLLIVIGFWVTIGRPEIRKDMEKKPEELLDRLKIVKVTSEGTAENPASKRPLPQHRHPVEEPTFGFEEPKHIPQGKCTLRQTLDFITKHQQDPKTHSIKSIAEARSMKESDIENIVKYFRVFELYVSRDSKTTVAKSTLERLGIGKVVSPMFKREFADLEPTNIPNELPEKK
ncbi:hypothetical protein AVEN_170584-1 [Araneus ventricosus]|uniref:Uncharacterized protein n=1 Tax=Araneus ventricosus TaxID=182803 RepID=A0A4Y2TWC6_ARAVE|nr:hypothetical protein AVEN_170584-1 [Araneus ventricosus]